MLQKSLTTTGSTAFKISSDRFLIPVMRKFPVIFYIPGKVAHRCLCVYVLFHHPCIKVHCDSSINRIYLRVQGVQDIPYSSYKEFFSKKISIRDIGISPATPAPFR